MKTESPPRLSVEITEEQRKELVRLIPWGVKSQLFSIIVDDVIEMLKKHGEKFLVAVLTHKLRLEDYSSTAKRSILRFWCSSCGWVPHPGALIPCKDIKDLTTCRCPQCGSALRHE